MIVSLGVAIVLETTELAAWQPRLKLVVGVGVTTATWLVVAFVTPPTTDETLDAFYRLVRPDGAGWRAVRSRVTGGEEIGDGSLPRGIAATAIGAMLIYACIFLTGFAPHGRTGPAAACTVVALVTGFLLYRVLAPVPAAER